MFAAAAFGAGIGVWVYLPHAATGASFLVLELVTITQIASRLWMKAASARWVALLPLEAVLRFAACGRGSRACHREDRRAIARAASASRNLLLRRGAVVRVALQFADGVRHGGPDGFEIFHGCRRDCRED